MCMNIEFKRCCSLPSMYVLYNNICVWMTTTKNFAIKLSRRTSYVTLSGKCVYCLINFVLLKKMSTKKWMACRNFPHLYLMYFCVLFWNNQKLCKRISILFPNYLVYDRNSVICIPSLIGFGPLLFANFRCFGEKTQFYSAF